MNASSMTADYVIVGAGAVGMAIADTLVAESEASVVLLDRRAEPGGHWNDAYPFVRLHGPSATYGVNSMPLGQGRVDASGLNQGHHELASGAEIRDYYGRVLRERLLASGRVRWLPLHEVDGQGVAVSLVNGRRTALRARRRWVDATRADTQVPATHGPRFAVEEGVRCLTPAELVQRFDPRAEHVIVGGGKTAMDTALWLLQQGVDPDAIAWIRPREAWLLNRAKVQPAPPFALPTLDAIVGELEIARDAASLPALFEGLEAARLLQRIDPAVEPSMYRCAIVSEAELAQLRRIRRVHRLGHVRTAQRRRIVLEHGELPSSPQAVLVHCSAGGLPRGPMEPMFQGPLLVPQYVRRCSPSFSAAFVAHLELSPMDDATRNALSEPVPLPQVPLDWLRMHLHTARNQRRWAQQTELQQWFRHSRLEAYSALFEAAGQRGGAEWDALQARLRAARAPGLERTGELLGAVQTAAV
jgi:hypothetical protein